MREPPQVFPGKVQVGIRNNSLMEKVVQGWNPHSCRDLNPCVCGTWGHGSGVGFEQVQGVFQPQGFHDSMKKLENRVPNCKAWRF